MTKRAGDRDRRYHIGEEFFVVSPAEPGLHVVSTPIGNLRDITLRALETLAGADRIACEDRRVTAKLLSRYGISRPLDIYNDHSGPDVRGKIVARLEAGGSLALVSDAGTPLISDPGYKLVGLCADRDIPVVPVPGASALPAALSVAGLPTDRVLFAGFPAPRSPARQSQLKDLAGIRSTLVFLESPRRVAASLADMADCLGPDRPASVCRELTKLHETIVRGRLGELARQFADRTTKGEIVVVVGPPQGEDRAGDMASADALLTESLAHMSLRDAAEAVAGATGLSRKAVYRRAIALKGGDKNRP